jgi:hypothetical protein
VQPDCVILIVVGHHDQDRPEDLLLKDPHARQNVGEHRRGHVVADGKSPGSRAAEGDRRPLVQSAADQVPDALSLGALTSGPMTVARSAGSPNGVLCSVSITRSRT